MATFEGEVGNKLSEPPQLGLYEMVTTRSCAEIKTSLHCHSKNWLENGKPVEDWEYAGGFNGTAQKDHYSYQRKTAMYIRKSPFKNLFLNHHSKAKIAMPVPRMMGWPCLVKSDDLPTIMSPRSNLNPFPYASAI